jgi:hypothetical protein
MKDLLELTGHREETKGKETNQPYIQCCVYVFIKYSLNFFDFLPCIFLRRNIALKKGKRK